MLKPATVNGRGESEETGSGSFAALLEMVFQLPREVERALRFTECQLKMPWSFDATVLDICC